VHDTARKAKHGECKKSVQVKDVVVFTAFFEEINAGALHIPVRRQEASILYLLPS
jgi:hypothetical protein